MSEKYFQLRTLTFIDSLQPQLVQYIARENNVCNPAEYDAALLIEIAPAMEIHHLVDLALKNTQVRLGAAVTERHFGLLQVQHADQGEVKEAGRAILREVGLDENSRARIELLANFVIRGVEQDHATLFTGTATGNMVTAGESVLIMEAAPAAYLAIVGNEALKAANIKLIELKAHGATGRLVLSGPEAEIDSAREAAEKVIDKLNEMQATKAGKQL